VNGDLDFSILKYCVPLPIHIPALEVGRKNPGTSRQKGKEDKPKVVVVDLRASTHATQNEVQTYE
jgi:hypothetical protein